MLIVMETVAVTMIMAMMAMMTMLAMFLAGLPSTSRGRAAGAAGMLAPYRCFHHASSLATSHCCAAGPQMVLLVLGTWLCRPLPTHIRSSLARGDRVA